MITKDTIDRIFSAARIDEVVGDFVSLKKRGINMIGLCPFHDEKTPSFTVSPAKGIYKCFGCGKAGNPVAFIMEHEQYTYPEALRHLAGRYNIEVEEEQNTNFSQENDERESLFIVSAYACETFTHFLNETDEGKSIGRGYFTEREISDESIEKFQLGYSPEGWDSFFKKAREDGHEERYLQGAGLIKEGEKGFYDTFRGRVIFPIHNQSGKVIAFGGRILKSVTKAPKYVNSPESDIYHKSRILYGIYFAKKAIIAEDNCYLSEGYTDVIMLHQSGIENTVASSGTSLTEDQIRLIKRYTPNITLLFDGDAAGMKAALRGVDMILKEGMNVKVVVFPEGEDPDSFARKSTKETLKEFLQNSAKDFMSFKLDLLSQDAGTDPVKKAGIIKEVVVSIAAVPDGLVRTLYIRECASTLSIPEGVIAAEVAKVRRSISWRETDRNSWKPTDSTRRYSEQQQEAKTTTDFQEREIVRLLLNFGAQDITLFLEQEGKKEAGQKPEKEIISVAALIIRELQADGIGLEHLVYNQIYQLFVKSLETGKVLDYQAFTEGSDSEIATAAIDLITEPYNLSGGWEKTYGILVDLEKDNLKESVMHSIHVLKMKRIMMMMKEIQTKIKDASEEKELNEFLNMHRRLLFAKQKISAELGIVIK